MPTQAEKDERIKAAQDAYENERTVKDEDGVERPRPYHEIKELWLELWEACDFSWDGLADAGWERDYDANFAQRLKQWRAPADFPGPGKLHGEGETAWKEASLQDYWRWSIGALGFEHVPAEDYLLLSDEQLGKAGLLRSMDKVNFHVLHIPGITALPGQAMNKGAGSAASAAQPSTALASTLLARLEAAQPYTNEKAPDRRVRLDGARALGLDACWRIHCKGDEDRTLHIVAALSELDGANCNKLTFGDKANFSSASFGNQARFNSAQFKDEVKFTGAQFGDNASFTSAKLGHKTDFILTMFGGGANFRFALFGDEAKFTYAQYGQEPDFSSAQFGSKAYFSSTKFGNNAHFHSATFGDDAYFFSATFGNSPSFASSKFGNRAYFYSASFGNEAYFHSAQFKDGADFTSAKFGVRAYFRYAEFGNLANFKQAEFKDEADFCCAMFGNETSFAAAKMKDDASFSYAKFGNKADFSDTEFGYEIRSDAKSQDEIRSDTKSQDEIRFYYAQFGNEASFSSAKFRWRVEWHAAVFAGYVTFADAEWDESTHFGGAFKGARFRDVADFQTINFSAFAALDEATFERLLLLSDPTDSTLHKAHFATACAATRAATTRKEDPIDPETAWSELSGGYRTAKKNREDAGDVALAQIYYRYELEARLRQPSTSWPEKIAARFYDRFSDFGASIGRPFGALALFTSLFAFLFLLIALAANEDVREQFHSPAFASWRVDGKVSIERMQSIAPPIWQALEFSMHNAVRPLSALSREEYDVGEADDPKRELATRLLYDNNGVIRILVRLLAIIQSLISLVLAFLFGLAVRRKFQIG